MIDLFTKLAAEMPKTERDNIRLGAKLIVESGILESLKESVGQRLYTMLSFRTADSKVVETAVRDTIAVDDMIRVINNLSKGE